LPGSSRSDIIAPAVQLWLRMSCEAEREPMLLDLGWSELLLIGVVALVFIGPKDLPKALRVAGFWVRKARTLSREFQSSIDQMIREADLEDIRKDFKQASEFDLNREFKQTVDPSGTLEESLKPPELPDFFNLNRPAPAADEAAPAAPAEGEPAPVENAPAAVEPPAEPAGPAAAALIVADDDVAYDIVSPKR
jgi:sec-independent protein translocase protein TatB